MGGALTPTLAAAADAGANDAASKPDRSQAAQEKDAQKQWAQTHRASKIIGAEVRNPEGEKIGAIKDLVVAEPSSGRISHAVIAVGGVLGMGDKLFAVPYASLRKSEGKDYFVLSSRSDLAQAFDDKHWPEMADATWKSGNDASAETGKGEGDGASARGTAPGETAGASASTNREASKAVGQAPETRADTSPAPSAADKGSDSNRSAASGAPDASPTSADSRANRSEQNATPDNSGSVTP